MPCVQLTGQLSLRVCLVLLVCLSILLLETLLCFTMLFLPKPIAAWFCNCSQVLFDRLASPRHTQTTEEGFSSAIRDARDFAELCALHGYEHEEHLVLTRDGCILTLHRIVWRKGKQAEAYMKKPVVYLHHGLLMSSEIWVCLTEEARCLPFVLAKQGFDVWLGNNRGNKYSKNSIRYKSTSSKFWNHSLNESAWYDIPDSIEYILALTGMGDLGYIGFSQGVAQAFAALSVNPQLNKKVNVLVALAPAMGPAGSAPIVDALMKAPSTSIYFVFGRKAILPSIATWQAILYPPIFTSIIDMSLRSLFSWDSRNITATQKSAAYAHLYSCTSVKSVVHWFQIMRESTLQLFDDDATSKSYHPTQFPTRNIKTPTLLLYGSRDNLVNIQAIISILPHNGVRTKELEGYEHLDVLWGRNTDKDVLPEVLEALRIHCGTPVSVWERKYGRSRDDSGHASGSERDLDADEESLRQENLTVLKNMMTGVFPQDENPPQIARWSGIWMSILSIFFPIDAGHIIAPRPLLSSDDVSHLEVQMGSCVVVVIKVRGAHMWQGDVSSIPLFQFERPVQPSYPSVGRSVYFIDAFGFGWRYGFKGLEGEEEPKVISNWHDDVYDQASYNDLKELAVRVAVMYNDSL